MNSVLDRSLTKFMHFRPPLLSVPLIRDKDMRPLVPHQMRRLSVVLNDTLCRAHAYPSEVLIPLMVMSMSLPSEAGADTALHTATNKHAASPSPRLQVFAVFNFGRHVFSPMSYTSILANALLRFRVLRRTINDLAQSLGAKIKLGTGFEVFGNAP